jgi:hypothetical protein
MSAVDRKERVTTERPTCASCGCHRICACACCCAEHGKGTDEPPLPLLTPYLVIPCRPGDPGTRPLSPSQVIFSPSQVIYSEAIGWRVANPAAAGGWHDFQLQVSCAVANLGPVASPAAMIEFYAGTDIAIRHMGHAELTPAEVKADVNLLGRASFTAPPGTVTTVTCPTPWVPGSADAAQQGIVVQVRDLFTDPWTAPFDPVNDRHVARNDDIMPRVWNTGVDPNAATLAPGAPDPHWQLLAGPGVANPRAPVVITEQHPGGAYFPTSDSMWIWQDAAGTADPGSSYTFRLPIDLTGYDLASVRISGAWGVDNDGTITFNGQPPTGMGTFSLTGGDVHDNYNLAHPFTITGGFAAGINTLDIQATNVDGPAALNVTRLMLDATPL